MYPPSIPNRHSQSQNVYTIEQSDPAAFHQSVEKLLTDGPAWVRKVDSFTRQCLSQISGNLESGYHFLPEVNCSGVSVTFDCKADDYRVVFSRDSGITITVKSKSASPTNARHPSSIVLKEKLTPEVVEKLPEGDQAEAKRLLQVGFPYEVTLWKDGSIEFGGIEKSVDRTVTLEEFLTQYK